MPDEDDFFEVVVDLERIHCDRYNTCAFTYFGKLAIYNHVYIDPDPDREDGTAFYTFRGEKGYNYMVDKIARLKFPAYINLSDVEEEIVDMYVQAQAIDLDSTKGIPKEWK